MSRGAETPEWRVATVEELPWAHFPWKCRWFKECAASTKQFGEFAQGLTVEQRAECKYHRGTDWIEAARVAVELVEVGATDSDDDAFWAPIEGHDKCTIAAIVSFFDHPIWLSGDELGGGQHRVCAMKLAGVERCPVER